MGERVYTVNEVIDGLALFCSQTARIRCVIQLEFEGSCILHIPKAERRDRDDGLLLGEPYRYRLSLWLSTYSIQWAQTYGYEIAPGVLTWEQLTPHAGRHVIVTASIDCHEHGHFGLWPAGVVLTDVVRIKKQDQGL